MKKLQVIAIVAAILAGLGIYRLLQEISKPAETPKTEVVVAVADIPENTTITSDMVALKALPTEGLMDSVLTSVDDVVGKVASSDILNGEPVLSGRLVEVGEEANDTGTLAYVIDPGMRAYTLAVDSETGLMNLLKPGNRVDVILLYSYNTGTGDQTQAEAAAHILLQNISILAVDNAMGKAGSTEAYGTVTLAVTPAQAVILTYSEAAGSLRLVLRSSVDNEPAQDVTVTQSDVQGNP